MISAYKNSFSLIFLILFNIAIPQKKNLQVEISGIDSEKGIILISLYKTETSFKNFRPNTYTTLKAKQGAMQYTFANLDQSIYAIGILHDLNGNLLMDKNFFGLPKEGFGFSKDAIGNFGPPTFAQAAIQLDGEMSTAKIKMKYY
jgi:uncharacterized protein (DUF2141 family)